MRSLVLAMLAPSAVACSGGGGAPKLPVGDTARPDIVLVSIDTLRADHLGSYGYNRDTSPFIDQLAAQGTRFAHARSASPWTLPAHTTMLSGQQPHTHKVVDDQLRLDPDTPVLPAVLQDRGYATGGFVATLYVSRLFGFDRGFSRFEDFGIDNEKKNLRGEVDAEHVVDAALKWWGTQTSGTPVFLFLHVYDVHYTYDPPGDYNTRYDRAPVDGDTRYKNYFYFQKHLPDDAQMAHQVAQYDEEIRYVDDQLARLQDAAKAAGRQVRWVVTSDHGEEFGERGSWGHAHTLYAEQLHVPLVISGAGIQAGQVVDAPVGHHDLAPTIAAWAGADAGALTVDGIDLAPVLEGNGSIAPDRLFVAETTRFKTNRLSAYQEGTRLEWDLKTGKRELFLTSSDPKEQKDVLRSNGAAAVALQRQLLEALGAPWTATTPGTLVADSAVVLPSRKKNRAQLATGDEVLVLPWDASVRFEADSGETAGPWAATGGSLPGPDGPLRYSATGGADTVTLDQASREQLEALGYIQSDEVDD